MRLDRTGPAGKGLKIAVTFLLVNAAWIFFRAGSVSDAMLVMMGMFRDVASFLDWDGFVRLLDRNKLGLDVYNFRIAVIAIIAMEIVHIAQSRVSIGARYGRLPGPVRALGYVLSVAIIVMFGSFEEQQFIYFQF